MNAYLKKICPLEEAGGNCEALKDSGKRIVFTNGCFDILHPGHARYLSSARELGDYLIVALNSDSSVQAIKGAKGPFSPKKCALNCWLPLNV